MDDLKKVVRFHNYSNSYRYTDDVDYKLWLKCEVSEGGFGYDYVSTFDRYVLPEGCLQVARLLGGKLKEDFTGDMYFWFPSEETMKAFSKAMTNKGYSVIIGLGGELYEFERS